MRQTLTLLAGAELSAGLACSAVAQDSPASHAALTASCLLLMNCMVCRFCPPTCQACATQRLPAAGWLVQEEQRQEHAWISIWPVKWRSQGCRSPWNA